MARDRQSAKQRQAERRARRLAAQRQQRGEPRAPERESREPVDDGLGQGRMLGIPGLDPGISTGAPPEDEGRSDRVVPDEHVPASKDEAIREIEDWEVGDEDHLTEEEIEEELDFERELADKGEEGFAPRGRSGPDEAEKHKDRPRVIQFLIAVWAELQRVQWPNRQAMVTLTGVVLGFVLIAGGYLGLLDAIFSEVIKAIL